MSKHVTRQELKALAVGAPVTPRTNRAERVFGLHPALFAITIGSYFLFLGIMAAAFMTPDLVLPFIIFAVYVAMAFGTPGLWARVRGRDPGPVQSWAQFRKEGVDIATGHLGSGAAVAQVVMLPVLLVGWGAAIAIIAAIV
jgi:hypothetical protein